MIKDRLLIETQKASKDSFSCLQVQDMQRSNSKLNFSASSDPLIPNQQGNSLLYTVLDRARKIQPIKIALKQLNCRKIKMKKINQKARKNFQQGKLHGSSLIKLSKQKRQRVNPNKIKQASSFRKKCRQKRGPPYRPIILSQKDLFGMSKKNKHKNKKLQLLTNSLRSENRLGQQKVKKMHNPKQRKDQYSVLCRPNKQQSFKDNIKQQTQQNNGPKLQQKVFKQFINKKCISDKKSNVSFQKINNETNSSKIVQSQALKRRTVARDSQFQRKEAGIRLKRQRF